MELALDHLKKLPPPESPPFRRVAERYAPRKMVARKRARDEMETEAPSEEPTALQRLRNMWQFANLAQYIFLFKGALKIDEDFDIEVRDCAPAPTTNGSPILRIGY